MRTIFEFPAENAEIADCLAGRQSMRTPEPLSQIRSMTASETSAPRFVGTAERPDPSFSAIFP